MLGLENKPSDATSKDWTTVQYQRLSASSTEKRKGCRQARWASGCQPLNSDISVLRRPRRDCASSFVSQPTCLAHGAQEQRIAKRDDSPIRLRLPLPSSACDGRRPARQSSLSLGRHDGRHGARPARLSLLQQYSLLSLCSALLRAERYPVRRLSNKHGTQRSQAASSDRRAPRKSAGQCAPIIRWRRRPRGA